MAARVWPRVTQARAKQRPISDYALIGDTRTAALCSSDGSIDWLCLPRFDSDPIFGRLVAAETGGFFSIAAVGSQGVERRYRDDSAVLETTWRIDSGLLTLTDGMVLDVSTRLAPQVLLVRHVRCSADRGDVRIHFAPRLGLRGTPPHISHRDAVLVCAWGALAVSLESSPDVGLIPGTEQVVSLGRGETLTFAMGVAHRAPLVFSRPEAAYHLIEETDTWWRNWSGDITYAGLYRAAVLRSLITLRLLTFSPSGAPVAAPTTSLPEAVGGVRNWDYRFSWPRDASIGLAAFLAVGKEEEARSFLYWLLHAGRLTRPRTEVLYTVHGKPGPPEQELWDVTGYRASRPVRIGNGASTQHQLDVYGWVLDAAWLFARSRQSLSGEVWRALAGMADFVANRWRESDAGIWEIRGEPRQYVHSKLMAWLALDRAIRISRTHRTRGRRAQRWASERDALAGQIRDEGFDKALGSYVWAYGTRELDASLLILPTLEFEEPSSTRLRGTVETVRRELDAGGPLLYRYRAGIDGLEGREGAFLPCSFWLVQALARMGRVEEAVALFGDLLALSNDVGLLPEEIDPSDRSHLGNFPQAFTHATVVQAALAIQEATWLIGSHPRRRTVGS
jgi:GH15 family glucan-1,4-alpha-glucosidase